MSATAAHHGIRIEVLTTIDALRAVRVEWTRLWERSPTPHVFTHPGWQIAAATAYATAREPRVFVARRAEALCGVLPLALSSGRLQFLGSPWSDYNDVLLDPDARSDDVLLELLGHVAAAGGATLDNLREDAWLARLRGRDAFGAVRLRTRFRSRCPTVLAPSDELDTLARKKSLVRHEKKLAKLGALELRAIDEPEPALARLPEFFRQHSRRRAFTGEGIVFRDDRARRFIAELFRELPRGQVLLHVVECGGEAAAMHLGFVSAGAFLWYKPTFDVDLWNLGPGEVLMRQLMLDARARALREFDFTIGEEEFKFRFANHTRDAFRIHVLPHGSRGVLRAMALDLRAAIDRRPRLKESLKRRVAPALSTLSALRRMGPRGASRRRHAIRLLESAPGDRILLMARRTQPDPRIRDLRLSDLADAALAHPTRWPPERMQAARKAMQRARALGLFDDDGLLCVGVITEGDQPHFEVIPDVIVPSADGTLAAFLSGVADRIPSRLCCDPRDRITLAAAARAGFVRVGVLAAPTATAPDQPDE